MFIFSFACTLSLIQGTIIILPHAAGNSYYNIWEKEKWVKVKKKNFLFFYYFDGLWKIQILTIIIVSWFDNTSVYMKLGFFFSRSFVWYGRLIISVCQFQDSFSIFWRTKKFFYLLAIIVLILIFIFCSVFTDITISVLHILMNEANMRFLSFAHLHDGMYSHFFFRVLSCTGSQANIDEWKCEIMLIKKHM